MLDPWTTGIFFGPFFGPFLDYFPDHLIRRAGRPLVIRKGWDTFYQYPGRSGRQTVVTEGGVEDEILERTEGWEVDVLITAID